MSCSSFKLGKEGSCGALLLIVVRSFGVSWSSVLSLVTGLPMRRLQFGSDKSSDSLRESRTSRISAIYVVMLCQTCYGNKQNHLLGKNTWKLSILPDLKYSVYMTIGKLSNYWRISLKIIIILLVGKDLIYIIYALFPFSIFSLHSGCNFSKKSSLL